MQIIKRNGSEATFNADKIIAAITKANKAAESKGTLTDEQMAKFDPVYRKYRSDIQGVTRNNREARVKKENITNENALKVLSARLANQILTATVKQRYLFVFAEVIEPLQVMKLYKVDEKISREAHKIIKYRETAAASEAKK